MDEAMTGEHACEIIDTALAMKAEQKAARKAAAEKEADATGLDAGVVEEGDGERQR